MEHWLSTLILRRHFQFNATSIQTVVGQFPGSRVKYDAYITAIHYMLCALDSNPGEGSVRATSRSL
jgi:hypothetical protein